MNIRCLLLFALLLTNICNASNENLKIAAVTTQPPLAPGERLLAPMHVDVKVSSEGKVTAIRPDPSLPASFSDLFSKAISQWKFSPAKRNGAPIDWATRITLMLTAIPVEKGFAMRISNVSTASTWIDINARLRAPQYPSLFYSHGRSAKVTVIYQISNEGRPDILLGIYVDGEPAKNKNVFANAAKEAVQNWKFGVLQWDDASYPEPVCIPIRFTLDMKNDKSVDDPTMTKSQCDIVARQFVPIYLQDELVGTML